MKTSKTTTEVEAGLVEPDWAMFIHHGVQCLVLRHGMMGHLCGYVRLPKDSPQYRAIRNRRKLHVPAFLSRAKRYKGKVRRAFAPEFADLDVHGGITFAGPLSFYRADRGFWVGFDCAHAWDRAPFLAELDDLEGVYRTFDYVQAEVRRLAEMVASPPITE